jgi:hypothetical protein
LKRVDNPFLVCYNLLIRIRKEENKMVDKVMTNKEMLEKLEEMRAFHASQVQALDLAIKEIKNWNESTEE